MAGDDGAILAVGMIACFFSAVMSAGLSYTCTGGSFDPDDFDTDKCLELFPKDTSGGGGGGVNDPGNYPPSDEYTVCKGLFYNEATTTCFGGTTAGIRWEWLSSDEALDCRAKTAKYSVVISSSYNNHVG